jgi:hypothetical protein
MDIYIYIYNMLNKSLLSDDDNIINYNKEWKKTLLYKLSFGIIKPNNTWKAQLKRIKNDKKNK